MYLRYFPSLAERRDGESLHQLPLRFGEAKESVVYLHLSIRVESELKANFNDNAVLSSRYFMYLVVYVMSCIRGIIGKYI